MAKRVQPRWTPPERKNHVGLKLYNSLTREKEEFVPQHGNRVLWYSCGPTVYDASHMGHARTYITFDIVRRIMSDYFGYDILYVMNVTDIDDKIIKRARQDYLYEKYVGETCHLDDILCDIKNVMSAFECTVKSTNNLDKKHMLEKILQRVERSLEDLGNAVKSQDEGRIDECQGMLLKEAKDPLADWLDKKFGADVTEHSIFKKLSERWEAEFHKDMDALNVLKPNVLTRVSEYIPEIVEFIRKIMDNGLAYESNGSVYFDVRAFESRERHFYAKLVPEAYGDTASLQEGEGDLCVTVERLSEKRSENDFALWKNSRAGEPWWESPWGKGRPGWHIECSVMASEICGETLDIHSGGVDLKFPHHDNELAQAEAYFDNPHWVQYFLHSGHLTIAGCKMSKSLKNFVTIDDALKKHSARQLRLAFLLHSWKDTLDYSDNTMNMAIQYEKMLNEFFLNVKCRIRNMGTDNVIHTFSKWSNVEVELNVKFRAIKDTIHCCLCDNIDTRGALDAIRDLISHCNIYTSECKNPNTLLLRDVAVYLTKMFVIFGAIPSAHDAIGFPLDNENNANLEEMVMPYLQVLSDFRQTVRQEAKNIKANGILGECDKLRDDILPNLGVRLEDGNASDRCRVKIVDREELLRDREAKKKEEEQKALEKEQRRAVAAALASARDEQRKISPNEMFKLEKDKFSQFDETGLPTHDVDGKELSKGQIKRLQKLRQAQEKRYNEYLATVENAS